MKARHWCSVSFTKSSRFCLSWPTPSRHHWNYKHTNVLCTHRHIYTHWLVWQTFYWLSHLSSPQAMSNFHVGMTSTMPRSPVYHCSCLLRAMRWIHVFKTITKNDYQSIHIFLQRGLSVMVQCLRTPLTRTLSSSWHFDFLQTGLRGSWVGLYTLVHPDHEWVTLWSPR